MTSLSWLTAAWLMVAIGVVTTARADDTETAKAAALRYLQWLPGGDVATAGGVFGAGNADEAVLLSVVAEYGAALHRFDHALVTVFGPDAATVVPPADLPAAVTAAKVSVKNADTLVTLPSGKTVVPVRRFAAGWRVPLSALLSRGLPFPNDEPARRYAQMADDVRGVAAAVERKQFKTAADAKAELARVVADAASGRFAQ